MLQRGHGASNMDQVTPLTIQILHSKTKYCALNLEMFITHPFMKIFMKELGIKLEKVFLIQSLSSHLET